jgi:hypothetical protein
MAKTDLTKGLLSRFDRLQGQRENWETHWQEVADYMQPRKADVTTWYADKSFYSLVYIKI